MDPWRSLQLVAVCCTTLLLAKITMFMVGWWRHRRQLHSLVPEARKAHWLLGHLAPDAATAKDFYVSFVRSLPRMYRRQIGPTLTNIALAHPDTIGELQRKSPPDSEFFATIFRTWLGNGLTTCPVGPKWARDRRLLSELFTPSMRRHYVQMYKDASTTLIDLWEAQLGESVDICKHFPMMAFDVILRSAMGAATNCQTETDENSAILRYSNGLQEVKKLLMSRLMQPWYYWQFLYDLSPTGRRFKKVLNETHLYSEELIRERRVELEAWEGSTKPRRDMLDMLITLRDDEGVGMNDVEIREQVDTFLFAGHDTTSAALQWAIYYLCEYPEVQDKCREEVQRVMEKCGGVDEFGFEQLSDLVYISQTINEVLRVGNVVTGVFRCPEEPAVVDGVAFPKDTIFNVSFMALHYNEQVWSDPDKFDPDRFSAEHGTRSQYSYLPFGCGPRVCLGKQFALDEMKVVLAMVVHKFRLRLDTDAPKPYWSFVLFSKPGPAVNVIMEEV